jgi:hypothetical protein
MIDAKQQPNGFFTNPLSLFGIAMGYVTHVGYRVQQLQTYLQSEQALPLPVLIVGGTAALLCVSLLLAVVVVWITACCDGKPKTKRE